MFSHPALHVFDFLQNLGWAYLAFRGGNPSVPIGPKAALKIARIYEQRFVMADMVGKAIFITFAPEPKIKLYSFGL